jgi:hypothetical protein
MRRLLILFVFASSFNMLAQDAVLLRINYKIGDVLLVEQDVSQNMGAQGGIDMKVEMNMTVTGIEGSVYSTQSKIKSVNMNMLQGGKIVSFDSSKKATDLDETGKMMKQQFDPMMLVTIFSKISTEGKVLESNVEPPTPSMVQFTKQAKGGMKFPEEKVTVGSSWKAETIEQGMQVKSIYTVSKIENGKVFIEVTGIVSGVGTGEIQGAVIVDVETGIQDTANIEMSINANGMAMTISTKTATTKI